MRVPPYNSVVEVLELEEEDVPLEVYTTIGLLHEASYYTDEHGITYVWYLGTLDGEVRPLLIPESHIWGLLP